MNNVKNIWKMLDKQFKAYPQDMAGGVTESVIKQEEDKLSLLFSKGYKEFLLKYGGAGIGSKFVYGLRKHKDMDVKLYTVSRLTDFYKNQKWPGIKEWYIISEDFDGNPIGIDPKGVVWLSDHDSGFEKVKLADNFEEFLYKLLTDTLYS